ncbi:MAG: ATP-binding cassette domain-containing protein [Gemmatimonadetes bacterium]|nr:ATP-binding cassette domain-containing protein [Gemmatimonadota bacterium]
MGDPGAAAAGGKATRTDAADVLLDVRHLTKHFPVLGGVLQRQIGSVQAVDDVSFIVRKGETLSLVGESGCGKTTTGRSVLRLVEPTSGQILFRRDALTDEHGTEGSEMVDLMTLDKKRLKRARRDIQAIFQDPNSSLSPRMTVRQILAEPFQVHKLGGSRSEIDDHIAELLRSVGLQPEYRNRYPHQFSGGQRQRIGIARALALQPKLIVADEPVSSLDVSIQGQVLNLLEDLQQQFGLTYVFIAHDLSVVEHISDHVAVMYLGKIVELATVESLYGDPRHPYTEALLSAVPVPDPDVRRKRIILEGSVPSPIDPPSGCRFHTRCAYAQKAGRLARCSTEVPELRRVDADHWVACHYSEDLTLRPVEPTSGSG